MMREWKTQVKKFVNEIKLKTFHDHDNIVAYVAGPYSGDTKDDVVDNIYRAEEMAKALWAVNIPTICPHKNSEHFENIASYKIFIKGYLRILESANLLVLLPGWENSYGTRKEVEQYLQGDRRGKYIAFYGLDGEPCIADDINMEVLRMILAMTSKTGDNNEN